jgi:hypothetical protein
MMMQAKILMSISDNHSVVREVLLVDGGNIWIHLHGGHLVTLPIFAIATNSSVEVENLHTFSPSISERIFAFDDGLEFLS